MNMEFIKKHVPILLSPTFWGITLSAFAKIIALNGWMDGPNMSIIAEWILMATGVNVIWKGAKKISAKNE